MKGNIRNLNHEGVLGSFEQCKHLQMARKILQDSTYGRIGITYYCRQNIIILRVETILILGQHVIALRVAKASSDASILQ